MSKRPNYSKGVSIDVTNTHVLFTNYRLLLGSTFM